jgi:hypothetical protein
LVAFAADLDWLQSQGHDVQRFNLAQDPAQFAGHADVQKTLAEEGVQCLPIVIIDGRLASRGHYPSREDLASWTIGTSRDRALSVVDAGGCCGDTGCC